MPDEFTSFGIMCAGKVAMRPTVNYSITAYSHAVHDA